MSRKCKVGEPAGQLHQPSFCYHVERAQRQAWPCSKLAERAIVVNRVSKAEDGTSEGPCKGLGRSGRCTCKGIIASRRCSCHAALRLFSTPNIWSPIQFPSSDGEFSVGLANTNTEICLKATICPYAYLKSSRTTWPFATVGRLAPFRCNADSLWFAERQAVRVQGRAVSCHAEARLESQNDFHGEEGGGPNASRRTGERQAALSHV